MLEYLINYPSLYPSLSGFVSNINWRPYALKRISCRQPNNMPYPKWFLHPPASSSSPTSTGKTSYAVFSSPSLQSTGQARATRSERRGKEGVGDSKPGSHRHVEHGEASPTSSVLSDGPGSCRETPLLSPPCPPSPSSLLSRLHLSQYMCHLNLWRPQFHPRDKSGDT